MLAYWVKDRGQVLVYAEPTSSHAARQVLQGARLDGADMRGIRGKYAVWRKANWWDATMDESLTKSLTKKWPRE